MYLSFWEKDFIQEKYDVTILGSGITGVSTAISMVEKKPGLRVCIIDRAPVSAGASTKNAGFSCFGSPTEVLDDLRLMGEKKTSSIIRMRWEGLQKLKERVPAEKISYQATGGYEIFEKGDPGLDLVSEKLNELNQFLEDATGLKKVYEIKKNNTFSHFSSRYVFNPYEGCLNPMLMMSELHKKARSLGVVFFPGVGVQKIREDENILEAENGLMIPFQFLVICTNGFTAHFFPDLPVWAARNQVLITKELDNLKLQGCYHYQSGYYYFRNVGNRILLGGARNADPVAEKTDLFGNTPLIQEKLLSFLDKIYPGSNKQVDYWWSGILGIGPDKEPITRWINEHVLCGVRLGGMGVAIGSHLGEILARELIIKLERIK